MLSKGNRPNTRIVEKVFKNKGFFSSKGFNLNYFIDGIDPKIGISVPKKVANRAVDRNLIKRRTLYIVRRYLAKLPKGLNAVLTIKKGGLSLFGGKKTKNHNPIENIEHEIKEILNKFNKNISK